MWDQTGSLALLKRAFNVCPLSRLIALALSRVFVQKR